MSSESEYISENLYSDDGPSEESEAIKYPYQLLNEGPLPCARGDANASMTGPEVDNLANLLAAEMDKASETEVLAEQDPG